MAVHRTMVGQMSSKALKISLTAFSLHFRYGSMMNEQVDSWQTPSSNFSLPLATDKCSDGNKQRSINNKSIHEIWSPDPSPNGLNNLSPSDEVLNNYQHSQQLLDSPSSIIDTSELSFEQVHSELGSPNFTTGHGGGGRIQQYEELGGEDEAGDGGGGQGGNNNLNYCYHPNIPSPVYTPYHSYPGVNNQRGEGGGGETYQDMMMRKNEMMGNQNTTTHSNNNDTTNDASSMAYDQDYYSNQFCMNNRYATPPHHPHHHQQQQQHYGRYQHRGGGRNHGKYHHQQHPVQMSYDLKMSLMEELGICLDECRDQLKHLERDYRKVRSLPCHTSFFLIPSLMSVC